MYKTQSDLNDKSVYPSIIVPAFWFISCPQSVDILSGNGENMRMIVDSVLYIVRSACKLRARRTEYKSVFFHTT